MTKIEITYCGETVTMSCNLVEASATIYVDDEPTQYQTADARHRTADAVRLACTHAWGPVYETSKEAEEDGRRPDAQITIWDDVAYRTL